MKVHPEKRERVVKGKTKVEGSRGRVIDREPRKTKARRTGKNPKRKKNSAYKEGKERMENIRLVGQTHPNLKSSPSNRTKESFEGQQDKGLESKQLI